MSEYEPKSKKRSFVLYYNNIETAFTMLKSQEERGELFTDICNFEMYGEEPSSFSNTAIEVIYHLISGTLKENRDKWLLRCKQNSINRTNGTNRTDCTDKEKDIDKDKGKEKEKERISSPYSTFLEDW